ncbi:MAG: hypothetical protein HWE18_14140 [Gammaproteobacteria bacterium]|nr:hypothetical protein [Gammaproteobacteria bacterium]
MTTNIETPTHLQDSQTLLSEAGFKTSNVWYHGTTSGLTNAILKEGLKRSGDKEINSATKKTMATIGNNYTERKDPIFLTQSKELAHFWANEKVRTRKVHTGNDETPEIIEVTLPDDLNANVKPDVGAVVMLMDLHQYMGQLEAIYQSHNLAFDLDKLQENAMEIPREEYLTKLGLAYYQTDIDSQYLSLVGK